MAVPKKRTSTSKKRIRKNIWKGKGYWVALKALTIISDWGGRSELEIDRKARIWARLSRKQKISILVLSSAMSLNLREILENMDRSYTSY